MILTSEQIVEYNTHKHYGSLQCPYIDSPFKLYKDMSSKRTGTVLEKIFEELMVSKGYEKRPNYSTDHDRVFVMNGEEVKFEVKGSTLWGEYGEGGMRWQQIRPSQDYDIMVFISVFPSSMNFYYTTKSIISDFVEVQDVDGYWPYNQHGGKKVNSGTFYIHGLPEDFPFMIPLEKMYND